MDPRFSVYYYVDFQGNNPIKLFLDSLNQKQQAKLIRIFHYLKDYGLQAILPHVKKIQDTPLWEIRVLGKDNIRVIYVIPAEKIVLVLHGFIKKKQKTPVKDIEIALKRYQDWINRTALDK
ncbi:MAG: type II toxin-antitoxin system RelE/ParE family toxin [Candidatus Daviesbacteria bacterium]|nr:type II toxin-antitoxin system RelE/ParE family toxin [Candidatus Daviesbacteria bacterium]